jgi:hypothetical protein
LPDAPAIQLSHGIEFVTGIGAGALSAESGRDYRSRMVFSATR